jgi:ATP-dependent DNA ligase
MNIPHLLTQLRNTNSPLQKVALLQVADTPELRELLTLTYDPMITYGIVEFSETTLNPRGSNGLELITPLLKSLSIRELSGNIAERECRLVSMALNPDWAEILRLILRRDLRCGVSVKTVNSAFPGLIKSFEVMRAHKYAPCEGKYYMEPKLDGLRCIAIVKGESVKFYSRNGKEFTTVKHLEKSLLAQGVELGDRVFDGELKNGNFNSSISAVKRDTPLKLKDLTRFYCWEMLPIYEFPKSPIPYEERRNRLMKYASSSDNFEIVSSYPTFDHHQRNDLYSHFLSQGHEGAIVKNPQGLYVPKRSKDWMKMKVVEDADLEVFELIEGEGKYQGMLGAAVVYFNGVRVFVGSGFSDEERRDFWNNPDQIMSKTIEIQYHEVTPDGSLRHPRFIKVRFDK